MTHPPAPSPDHVQVERHGGGVVVVEVVVVLVVLVVLVVVVVVGGLHVVITDSPGDEPLNDGAEQVHPMQSVWSNVHAEPDQHQ